MLEFETQNGKAKVVINKAKYKEAVRLKNLLLTELKKESLSFKLKTGNEANTKSILEQDIELSGFIDFVKNIIISIDTSDSISEALFSCLQYCTYNLEKINLDLYDRNDKIWEDDYEIKIKCIEENLRPFLKSAASEWKRLSSIIGESQTFIQVLAEMSK